MHAVPLLAQNPGDATHLYFRGILATMLVLLLPLSAGVCFFVGNSMENGKAVVVTKYKTFTIDGQCLL